MVAPTSFRLVPERRSYATGEAPGTRDSGSLACVALSEAVVAGRGQLDPEVASHDPDSRAGQGAQLRRVQADLECLLDKAEQARVGQRMQRRFLAGGVERAPCVRSLDVDVGEDPVTVNAATRSAPCTLRATAAIASDAAAGSSTPLPRTRSTDRPGRLRPT